MEPAASEPMQQKALEFGRPNVHPLTPFVDALGQVDWDFAQNGIRNRIEGIHPYPAKFIADLPRALLDALPIPEGTAVLDPFCGSGTTLVEAQRKGIPAIGVDLNPIACLMSRVKTSACPNALECHAREATERAAERGCVAVPNIPNLDHWFEPEIQRELSALTKAIGSAPVAVRDCLRLALSSIIVRVSNQESDTRYAAVAKKVSRESIATWFLRAAGRIGEALRERTYSLSEAEVIEGDVLDVSAERIGRPVGLVITSPPYPNAYEYWLYHKYRMWWLGFDPLAVKSREIGARAHFFRGAGGHTAQDFARQMQQTFALLGQVVVPDGFVCFVVGRSRIHGEIVDNARIVERAAEGQRFQRCFAAERTLSARRKSFNLSHANIKTETVLVLRRDARCD